MTILTASDRDTYFPDVSLEGRSLTGLLRRAQMLAESSQGANRPLELQSYTEVIRLNLEVQQCQLSRSPIAETPTPTIEIRSTNTKDQWGRSHGVSSWYPLSAQDYVLDSNGELHLTWVQGWRATEVKATYTTGFDFDEESFEIEEIKSVVGAIASFLDHPIGKGIARDESAGVIFQQLELGKVPESYLLPLRKYRPRRR